MSLNLKSAWIFCLIILLIALAGSFPSPATIGVSIMIGSALIIYQVILVLKDEKEPIERWTEGRMYRDRP